MGFDFIWEHTTDETNEKGEKVNVSSIILSSYYILILRFSVFILYSWSG